MYIERDHKQQIQHTFSELKLGVVGTVYNDARTKASMRKPCCNDCLHKGLHEEAMLPYLAPRSAIPNV